MDTIDLSDPRNPKLIATGPRLDPTECVASVVSNGRIFYISQASGLETSLVQGADAAVLGPPWERR